MDIRNVDTNCTRTLLGTQEEEEVAAVIVNIFLRREAHNNLLSTYELIKCSYCASSISKLSDENFVDLGQKILRE